MNKIIYSIIFLSMGISTVQAEHPDEISLIKKTAMDYMESWYKADAEKMKGSLHKELAKRSLQDTLSGKKSLRLTSASDMVAYTKLGYGPSLPRENKNIEVIVFDYYKNIASVKVIAPHYLEYLHLAKVDNKWVIVNALYENKSPSGD